MQTMNIKKKKYFGSGRYPKGKNEKMHERDIIFSH